MLDFKIDLMSKTQEELIKKYVNKNYDLRKNIYNLTYFDDFIMLDNEICDKLISICNGMKKQYNAISIIDDYDLMITKLEEEKKGRNTDNLKRLDAQFERILIDINTRVTSSYHSLSKENLDDILASLLFIERVHINMENTRNDLDPVFRYINRKSFERRYDSAIKNFDKRLEKEKILVKTK